MHISLAEDIDREITQPARDRVLQLLLPEHERELLQAKLAAAFADLPQPQRLFAETRAWEQIIRELQAQPVIQARRYACA